MKRVIKEMFCLALAIVVLLLSDMRVWAKESQTRGGNMLEALYEEVTMDAEIIDSEIELEYESNMQALYLESVMKIESLYNNYFGGCYLKNGELIIKITDIGEEVVSYFEKIVSDVADYEMCSVSLEELEAIKSQIEKFVVTNKDAEEDKVRELIEDIVCIATYVEENAVCVSIKDYSEEKISLFKELVTDSEHIIFESAEGYIDEVSYVKPGEKIIIMVDGSGKEYSMGFRCKRLKSDGTYAKGFVTAAHGGPYVGNVVYTSGWQQIGNVLAKSYSNGGSVDAVFVEVTNSNYDCSNTVYSNGTVLTGGTATLSVGSSVSKYGYATALTSGTIKATNATLTDSSAGITTYNLYQATYSSSSGDSGGVVFDPSSKLVAGIHKGRLVTTSVNAAYAVKTANIRSALSVTLY